jgi:hypothetical protein
MSLPHAETIGAQYELTGPSTLTKDRVCMARIHSCIPWINSKHWNEKIYESGIYRQCIEIEKSLKRQAS